MAEYKGKIEVEAAKRFMADHYDAYLLLHYLTLVLSRGTLQSHR